MTIQDSGQSLSCPQAFHRDWWKRNKTLPTTSAWLFTSLRVLFDYKSTSFGVIGSSSRFGLTSWKILSLLVRPFVIQRHHRLYMAVVSYFVTLKIFYNFLRISTLCTGWRWAPTAAYPIHTFHRWWESLPFLIDVRIVCSRLTRFTSELGREICIAQVAHFSQFIYCILTIAACTRVSPCPTFAPFFSKLFLVPFFRTCSSPGVDHRQVPKSTILLSNYYASLRRPSPRYAWAQFPSTSFA